MTDLELIDRIEEKANNLVFSDSAVKAEREACALAVEAHIIRDHTGRFVLDPNSQVFDRNTSLLAAAMNIRSRS